jgi:hypothetical protein
VKGTDLQSKPMAEMTLDDFKPFSFPYESVPRKRYANLHTACFCNPAQAVLFPMTPAPRKAKATDGAIRAAKQIERNPSFIPSAAEIIDRETGVRELLEMLENMIAEAGDLIERPSSELVAQARSAVRRYADESPRQAE